MAELKHYQTRIAAGPDDRVHLPVPFDPNGVWGGARHLGGALNTLHFRGLCERVGDGWVVTLSPMWLRDCGLKAGDTVSVVLTAEGPLRSELAEDIAAALAASPKAALFWDELAPFYRKAYEKWVESTKRKPDVRAVRIAELVDLMSAGVKARPKD